MGDWKSFDLGELAVGFARGIALHGLGIQRRELEAVADVFPEA